MSQKQSPPPIGRDEKTVVFATKLSPWFAQIVYEAIEYINQERQKKSLKPITRYEVGQQGIESWVMANSPMLKCPEKYMSMLHDFQRQPGMMDAFSLADPSADPYVSGVIYFVKSDGKKGEHMIYVGESFFANFNTDMNAERNLERVYQVEELKSQRDDLMIVAKDEECQTIYETIDILLRQWHERNDVIHDGFDDNKRSDFGRPIDYTKFNRKPKREIDSPSLFPELTQQDNDD